jgi:zinc transport system permease protein
MTPDEGVPVTDVAVVDGLVALLHQGLSALASSGALPPAFAHAFLARALLVVLLVTPLFGALGVLVTARRLAFFSTALGQAAMAGVAVGVALGEPIDAPWAGLLGTTTLCAVWLVVLRRHTRLPADTLTGVFLALTLAVGVAALVVVTRRFNVHQLEGVLFGSPLTVQSTDLVVVGVVAVVVSIAAIATAPALLLDALDPGLAAAAGRRALAAELVFVVALAAAVVVGSRVVGALLVEALVVVPAATARALGVGLLRNVIVAVVVALAAGVLGLIVSAASPVPVGAALVLCGGVFFVVAVVVGRRS